MVVVVMDVSSRFIPHLVLSGYHKDHILMLVKHVYGRDIRLPLSRALFKAVRKMLHMVN